MASHQYLEDGPAGTPQLTGDRHVQGHMEPLDTTTGNLRTGTLHFSEPSRSRLPQEQADPKERLTASEPHHTYHFNLEATHYTWVIYLWDSSYMVNGSIAMDLFRIVTDGLGHAAAVIGLSSKSEDDPFVEPALWRNLKVFMEDPDRTLIICYIGKAHWRDTGLILSAKDEMTSLSTLELEDLIQPFASSAKCHIIIQLDCRICSSVNQQLQNQFQRVSITTRDINRTGIVEAWGACSDLYIPFIGAWTTALAETLKDLSLMQNSANRDTSSWEIFRDASQKLKERIPIGQGPSFKVIRSRTPHKPLQIMVLRQGRYWRKEAGGTWQIDGTSEP